MSLKTIHKHDRQKHKPGKPVSSDLKMEAELAAGGHEPASLWHDPFVHILLILFAGFAVYFNTIASPFVFDDYINLVDNPAFKDFGRLPGIAQYFGWTIDNEIQPGMYLRPVVFFTFAVNHALHGLEHFGYHLTNLLIHLCNGLLVYLFFSRIQAAPGIDTTAVEDKKLWYLPLFAALVFVCHPIQTQSVTYIVQRSVPLATLFYLGALVLYGISRVTAGAAGRPLAYGGALVATILAMGSKEIAFTLPVVIMLYEFMFFEGKLSSRLVGLIPFLMTMSIVPMKLVMLGRIQAHQPLEQGRSVIQGALALHNVEGISWFDYLITQFGVIVTYLRLLLLPVGQNLDHDVQLQKLFFSVDVIAPLLLLLALAGSGVWCLLRSGNDRRYRIIAFGIFWFFITLSVESSFVPIKDLIFEHRVYLPSVGFFMALFAAVSLVYQRVGGSVVENSKMVTALLALLVVMLAFTSIARNRVWKSEIALWRDVVSKSPNKARVHNNLGFALHNAKADDISAKSFAQGKREVQKILEEAVKEYRQAIRLDPTGVQAYTNLAEVQLIQGKYDEAFGTLALASGNLPDNPLIFLTRGKIYELQGDLAKAAQDYREAIRLYPQLSQAHVRLADVLSARGEIPEAIAEYEAVIRVYPKETVKSKLAELKRRQGQ